MLTLITIPKAFKGHIGVIQRNAIKSWKLLSPACQVILLGDDPGVAQAAEELGVKNIPNVNRNEFGTPLLDSANQLAEEVAVAGKLIGSGFAFGVPIWDPIVRHNLTDQGRHS